MRTVLFLLMLIPAALLAQPATPQSAAPEPAATSQPEGENQEQDSETPAARRGSPFDYEASEQISEDLSVSFPVDI